MNPKQWDHHLPMTPTGHNTTEVFLLMVDILMESYPGGGRNKLFFSKIKMQNKIIKIKKIS